MTSYVRCQDLSRKHHLLQGKHLMHMFSTLIVTPHQDSSLTSIDMRFMSLHEKSSFHRAKTRARGNCYVPSTRSYTKGLEVRVKEANAKNRCFLALTQNRKLHPQMHHPPSRPIERLSVKCVASLAECLTVPII